MRVQWRGWGGSKSDEYHELRLSRNIFPNNVDNSEDTGPNGVGVYHEGATTSTVMTVYKAKLTADNYHCVTQPVGPPWWFRRKESACSAGDLDSVLGLRRSPGEGHGNPI